MSTDNRIQKIVRGNRVAVVDEETGAAGEGGSVPEALEDLASTLRAVDDLAEGSADPSDHDTHGSGIQNASDVLADIQHTSAFISAAMETKERFDVADMDEEQVEKAIRWARSE